MRKYFFLFAFFLYTSASSDENGPFFLSILPGDAEYGPGHVYRCSEWRHLEILSCI